MPPSSAIPPGLVGLGVLLDHLRPTWMAGALDEHLGADEIDGGPPQRDQLTPACTGHRRHVEEQPEVRPDGTPWQPR